MFKSKYSTVLTIILIVVIVAILIIAALLAINAYKSYADEKERKKIYATFQNEPSLDDNNNENSNNINGENLLIQQIENNTTENETTEGNTTSRPKTKFYKDYPMVGYIKIPKTGIEYPILLEISPGALEVSVGVMYPSNPKLNQPGNVVIIGHNYRNGKLFSNNKKLVIGDKIQITDLTGKTLEYTIYEISTIPETDTEYITRDRGNNIEVSLSTCTDDGLARLVILAKVM